MPRLRALQRLFCAAAAHAQSVEDFYKGKTINLVIGFSVGGGYDLYARMLARHMGKHIPGNPTIVPQNMPGAGGCAWRSSSTRPRRRTALTFGTFTRMAGIAPLFDRGADLRRHQVHLARQRSPTTSASASPGTPRR